MCIDFAFSIYNSQGDKDFVKVYVAFLERSDFSGADTSFWERDISGEELVNVTNL